MHELKALSKEQAQTSREQAEAIRQQTEHVNRFLAVIDRQNQMMEALIQQRNLQ